MLWLASDVDCWLIEVLSALTLLLTTEKLPLMVDKAVLTQFATAVVVGAGDAVHDVVGAICASVTVPAPSVAYRPAAASRAFSRPEKLWRPL
ncbi:MAG: hypothetical protein KGQ77_01280 [Betaproteobacteria bacterium]|nr:hypothetical protein [Betaproteobacteria bacterium]